jgi:hypothetical protein
MILTRHEASCYDEETGILNSVFLLLRPGGGGVGCSKIMVPMREAKLSYQKKKYKALVVITLLCSTVPSTVLCENV